MITETRLFETAPCRCYNHDMDIEAAKEFIPFFDSFSEETRKKILSSVTATAFRKGETVHRSDDECTGMTVVTAGNIRAYTDFESGRQVTLYRLMPHDMCLFSASCIFSRNEVPISLEAETDCSCLNIPVELYKKMESESPDFASLSSRIMQERFADVFTLLRQMMGRRLNARIAEFLLDEAEDDTVSITQERLAAHLGSAREAVNKVIRQMESDGIIRTSRGKVRILDKAALSSIV